MMVIECECGTEVPFTAEDGRTSPMKERCDECDRVWKLTVQQIGAGRTV